MRKIDKARDSQRPAIAPQVAAKLAAYDASGAYALAWGWSATGLLYDAGKAPRAARRRAQFLGDGARAGRRAQARALRRRASRRARRDVHRRLAPLGVDPARLRERDVEGGGRPHHPRARRGAPAGFARPDHGDRRRRGLPHLRRRRAGRDRLAPQPGGRRRLDIRFAEPREGGPMAIDALAVPRDAPHPQEALALIDFLLRPAVAAEATAAAGLDERGGGCAGGQFPRLWPVGVYDPALVRSSKRNGRARALRREQPEAKPQSQAREQSRKQAEKDKAMTAKRAQHPHRHGRPDGAGVPADLRPCAHARAAHAGAGAKRRRVRQRLLREPAVFALARLVHGRAPAVAHPRLRQRGGIRGRHPDLRPSSAACAAIAPSSPARCISAARTSCTASRSG